MDIKDKVFVITGGASGLGRATAQRVVQQGGKAALVDLNLDLAKKTAAELGSNAAAFGANVADEDSAAAAINDIVKQLGAIHVNVNCAGVGTAGKTTGKDGPLSLKAFNTVIQINLVGTFNVLRLCAAQMEKQEPVNADNERGVIINTASIAAFDGQVGQAAYSASKAGVAGMTLPIARDLARSGIRVCTIAPGIFETPMLAGAPERVRIPLIEMVQFPKRLGQPEQYAALACHIVENNYLNAEVIRLDAGIRMQPR